MSTSLVPGDRVRHPLEPDWGVGQVQSVIGTRVTVNFEHAAGADAEPARGMSG